ncbi:MAG TPA: hypothetical protein VHY37_04755 [Tepidisphaeraceae bacterium]|jgi:hypothetical protein|nr:hypothetical protein [Tepidisphaeraceae bacterium]
MWQWIQQFDRLLRGELTALPALRIRGLDVPVLGLAFIIDVLGMAYGACMGLFALTTTGSGYPMQIPASMIKVPALYLLTLVVTLPSLYVFNALLGSRLTLSATTRLLVCSLAVMLAVLSSGGPIVAFFSLCTSSYYFMLLLNVTVFAIAGAFGLGFMLQTLHRMTLVQEWDHPESAGAVEAAEPTGGPALSAKATAIAEGQTRPAAPPPSAVPPAPREKLRHRRSTRNVFFIWLIVFSLVGAQMGWVLRPFIGHAGAPFHWFSPKESNFFEAVAEAIEHLANGESNPPAAGWQANRR